MRCFLNKKIVKLILCIFLGIVLQNLQPIKVFASEDFQPLFDQALQESKDGYFSKALSDWDKFLERFPDNPAAISNRGNCLLALGDFQSAISAQSRAIELLPDNPDSYLNRGIAKEALAQWDSAAEDYSWILDRFPTDPLALYNLGNIKIYQGNWLAAKDLFTKSLSARSEFPMALSSKALVEYQLGDFETVESDLRILIRKYPMFADARAGLSALLWRRGFAREAKSHWVAAIGLDGRYQDRDWLLNIRRWPVEPINDLMNFIDAENL